MGPPTPSWFSTKSDRAGKAGGESLDFAPVATAARGITDAGRDQHALEFVHIGGRERFTAADLGHDLVGEIVGEEASGTQAVS